jgi:integrase
MNAVNRRQISSNRFLPQFVTSFKDRHGKTRLRFRRKGFASHYFAAPLGTEEFRVEYHACMNPAAQPVTTPARHAAGTVADLRARYYAVPDRLGPTATTQTKVRAVLDRGFFIGRETRPVALIHFDAIDKIIAKRRQRTVDEKGRAIGGVEAARKLRKELVRLFDFAAKIGMIPASPMHHVGLVKVAPAERSSGFYPWNEDDIAAYRARWKLGTKQRLAMELLLWTDQRKVDAIHLGRQHVRGGKFAIRQTKTAKQLVIDIAAPLANAISAMPPSDALCFIVTETGKPYSVKGFGNWFRRQCDAAGLTQCTAHGLRKATLRRMAELEMSNKSMKSVSGHTKDEEINRYTESANQERLATSAIARLVAWERASGPRDDEAAEVRFGA